jgi:glycosyltransferase involved in cell wall biosynthesis
MEVGLIKHYCPECNIMVVSNIHDFKAQPTSCHGRAGVMFVGSLVHLPNQQAIEQLLEHVLPRVKPMLKPEQLANFRVHIVGSNELPDRLRQLLLRHADNVVFHGSLSDESLQLLYSRVRISVAPLLSGAGVKGKVRFFCREGSAF